MVKRPAEPIFHAQRQVGVKISPLPGRQGLGKGAREGLGRKGHEGEKKNAFDKSISSREDYVHFTHSLLPREKRSLEVHVEDQIEEGEKRGKKETS